MWPRYLKNGWRVGLAVLLLLAAGCGTFRFGGEREPAELRVGPPGTEEDVRQDRLEPYRIGLGDQLDIMFQSAATPGRAFRLNVADQVAVKFPSLPQLSSAQAVRPDGVITLPYVGDLRVMGLTPAEATAAIREAYEGVLWEPDVYVEVTSFGQAAAELKRAIASPGGGQRMRVLVRQDGMATFPTIGDMLAVGKTIPDLTDDVRAAYGPLAEELQIDVSLAESAAQYVYVVGEVNRPGAHPVTGPVTSVEALALASGATADAVLSGSVVMRRQENKLRAYPHNVAKALKGKDGAEVALLYPGDALFVPRSLISSAADLAADLSQILFFRGMSVSLHHDLDDSSSGSSSSSSRSSTTILQLQ